MKQRTTRQSATLFLGVCLWVLSGCVPWQQPQAPVPRPSPEHQERKAQRPSMQSAPSARWILQRYTDLPIPKGYTLRANESFVFMQGGLRSADLKYTGPLSVSDLIRFYQDSMPANGWRFLRMTGVRMKTITFFKGTELCEIIIMAPMSESTPPDTEGMAHLHIKLNPR